MSSLAFQLAEPPQNGNVNPIDSNQQPQINALHISKKRKAYGAFTFDISLIDFNRPQIKGYEQKSLRVFLVAWHY